LPFVDVATGSLGQGLCAGVGIALNARRIGSDYRTYVLMGDGESAEGAVWEAAQIAAFQNLDSLCGVVDVNGLGQSRGTMFGHDVEAFVTRWRAFGWHAIAVDGHDIPALQAAFAEARRTAGKPTMIVAKTFKGKGVSELEGKDGWHGKAIKPGKDLERVIRELQGQIVPTDDPPPSIPRPGQRRTEGALPDFVAAMPAPEYQRGEQVATREAYGAALVALGRIDRRVVALDADVKNSTYSEHFEKAFPDRFYQNFIAEQVMVGSAMGLASRGAIPFPSSFACFLERASDFIRMAGISNLNIKMAGSHAGVSIGEDGPSQMALEDLAMMRAELYRAVSLRRRQRVPAHGDRGGDARAGLHPHHTAEDAGALRQLRALRVGRFEDAPQERPRHRHRRGRRHHGVRGACRPPAARRRWGVHPRHRRLFHPAHRP